METVLTFDPIEASEYVKRGGIVAFPTETVYGLGANVFDAAAVARIFEAKMRPADNPLIAHVSDVSQIGRLVQTITGSAEKLIDAFFPGPLTVVLAKSEAVPYIATAGLDTIGIRMPGYDLAHRFLVACGVPIVAPSANLSGKPSPTTWQAVKEDLDGRIDCILQGDPTEIGLESTVVDCTSDRPMLLRLGSVSLSDLKKVVPDITEAQATDPETARSPGLRHRHYSPRAHVVLTGDIGGSRMTENSAFIGLQRPSADFRLTKICRNAEEYARLVFEFFRECDRAGIETIYCETVPDDGIGAALNDRLRRAAEY